MTQLKSKLLQHDTMVNDLFEEHREDFFNVLGEVGEELEIKIQEFDYDDALTIVERILEDDD